MPNFLIIISKQTSNVATHVKHRSILFIKTRTLIAYAVVHQVVVSVVKLALEVCSAHTILLGEVCMIVVGLSWSTMQVFIASLVSSGNRHRCLVLIEVLTFPAILHVRSQISNARSSAASHDPFSLILLTRLLVRSKILIVLKRYYFLELGQETASIQILWKCEIVELLHHSLISAGFLTGTTIDTIRKTVCRIMIRNQIRCSGLNQVRVIYFILIWVVSACSSLTLNIGLLHYFILVRNDKLLVGRISSGNHNLSPT